MDPDGDQETAEQGDRIHLEEQLGCRQLLVEGRLRRDDRSEQAGDGPGHGHKAANQHRILKCYIGVYP